MSENQVLKQAYQLIKVGKRREAQSLITRVLKENQDNANAWWLMANCADSPNQARVALKHVLRLQPKHPKARKMLNKLKARYPEPAPAVEADESSVEDPFDYIQANLDAISTPAAAPPAAQAEDDPFEYVAANIGIASNDDPAPLPDLSAVSAKKSGGMDAGMLMIMGVAGVVVIAALLIVVLTLANQTGTGGGATCPPDMAHNSSIINDDSAVFKGCIEVNQPIYDVVDTFDDDVWAFYAIANTRIVIRLNSRDINLDPMLKLYSGNSGRLIAENDDIEFMEDYNSRIVKRLSETGVFYIRVSAFGQGGAYELILES